MSRWGRGRGRVAGPITRRSGVVRGRATSHPDRLACTSACRTPGTRRSRSWRWSIRCALGPTPCDGGAAGGGGGGGGGGGSAGWGGGREGGGWGKGGGVGGGRCLLKKKKT